MTDILLNITEQYAQDFLYTPGYITILVGYQLADTSFSGVLSSGAGYAGILDTVEDIPNNKFTSIEAILDHYYPIAVASILSDANSYPYSVALGLTYAEGARQKVADTYQAIYDVKQPLHSTLTDLSGVTIAPDVVTMLGDPTGKAGLCTTIAGQLALDSAAFVPTSTFATPSSVSSAISTAINSLINSAPGTLDTLGEIATKLASDESVASALASTVAGKVDKITGKGLSTEDYSTAEKSKLSGLATQIQSDWIQATTSALDYIKNKPSIPVTTRTTSTLSLSLVGTGATGTLISSTKDSTVRCTVSTSTTSTIGGPATSLVALKICSTNNATEASWTTVGTIESDQTITLAIVLNSVQVVKGQITADVPAGWYVKLVNSGSGTHTESYVSGQQTIYG